MGHTVVQGLLFRAYGVFGLLRVQGYGLQRVCGVVRWVALKNLG